MAAEIPGLRERIRALPGLDRLLPALGDLPPAFLVGGAVRDLLRGAAAVDLDVAVEGDGRVVAAELAARLGGETLQHERFGTATVRAGDLVVDVATTRRERYERPGALPEVEAAPLAEDLARRDFTVNALAADLTGDDLGRLHDPHGGRIDLGEGTIRVLHDQSFVDDPTRLLRAVRYEARLDARMDRGTERLAADAVVIGALRTVSGKRVRDELLDLLGELESPKAVARLCQLGLDRALHPELRPDPELVASAALGSLETGADPALAALAALALGEHVERPGADEAAAPADLTTAAGAVDLGAVAGKAAAPTGWIARWLDELQLRREQRDAVLDALRHAPGLRGALRTRPSPSALHMLLDGRAPETLALTLALGAPAEPVLRFRHELRHVRLEITGDDLRAAGVPEGPALGRALAETLRRKLDGELRGRDEELAAALAAARDEPGGPRAARRGARAGRSTP